MQSRKFLIALTLCTCFTLLTISTWTLYLNGGAGYNQIKCAGDFSSYRRAGPDLGENSTGAATRNVSATIPNVVHYVWFQRVGNGTEALPFRFHHMLAVLSAHKTLRPDAIYFHCDREPGGDYWEEVKRIPSVRVLHRPPPRTLYGAKTKPPKYETSDSNIARVQIILERGGIYLDLDVIVIQPLTPLLHHPCVLGLEAPGEVCAGVIMGKKHTPFLYLWINYFIDDYRVGTWAYNSGKVPSKLVKRYPGLVHVEPTKMHRPNWKPTEVVKIWGNETFDWINNYTVHLWYRRYKRKSPQGPEPDKENIRKWKGGFGEIARYIMYDELPNITQ